MAITIDDLRMRGARAAIHLVYLCSLIVTQSMTTIINTAIDVASTEPGHVITVIHQVTRGRRHVWPVVRASIDLPVVYRGPVTTGSGRIGINHCNGVIPRGSIKYVTPHQRQPVAAMRCNGDTTAFAAVIGNFSVSDETGALVAGNSVKNTAAGIFFATLSGVFQLALIKPGNEQVTGIGQQHAFKAMTG